MQNLQLVNTASKGHVFLKFSLIHISQIFSMPHVGPGKDEYKTPMIFL